MRNLFDKNPALLTKTCCQSSLHISRDPRKAARRSVIWRCRALQGWHARFLGHPNPMQPNGSSWLHGIRSSPKPVWRLASWTCSLALIPQSAWTRRNSLSNYEKAPGQSRKAFIHLRASNSTCSETAYVATSYFRYGKAGKSCLTI